MILSYEFLHVLHECVLWTDISIFSRHVKNWKPLKQTTYVKYNEYIENPEEKVFMD